MMLCFKRDVNSALLGEILECNSSSQPQLSPSWYFLTFESTLPVCHLLKLSEADDNGFTLQQH